MSYAAQRLVMSAWTPWSDRKSIEGSDEPGVYALAHFREPPDGPAHPDSEAIVYIGETCGRSLRIRWREFNMAANGRAGHSGGTTHFRTFRELNSELFVAALPLGHLDEPLRSTYIRFVERRLLLGFVERWRRLPVCNKK